MNEQTKDLSMQSRFLPELTDLVRRLLQAGIKLHGISYDNSIDWEDADEDSESGAYLSVARMLRELNIRSIGKHRNVTINALAEFGTRGDDGYIVAMFGENPRWIKFTLGNRPGELISDWIVCTELDAVCEAHAKDWEDAVPQLRREAY